MKNKIIILLCTLFVGLNAFGAGYGVVVNGSTFFKGTYMEYGMDPNIKQYYGRMQVTAGDYCQLYYYDNENQLSTWAVNVDEHSCTGFVRNGNRINVSVTGCYEFYMKLGNNADIIYIGPGNNNCQEGDNVPTHDSIYDRLKFGNLYYNLDTVTKTAEVTSENLYSPYWYTDISSAKIPSSLVYRDVEYEVTSIGTQAFYSCSNLSDVTIPNSVVRIEESAFYGCSKITSVVIPENISYIGSSAFGNCNNLKKVTINSNAITKSKNQDPGIVNSYSSKKVTINTNFIALENRYGCSRIFGVQVEEYIIGGNVTTIADGVFRGCSALKSVTIGEGVTFIGDYAFDDNTNLPVVDNIRYADTYLVEVVDKTLQSYTIKEGTKWIGGRAFLQCQMTTISIPNSIISIGEEGFAECVNLTHFELPNNVTRIGKNAFVSCHKLTEPIYNAHIFAVLPESYAGDYRIPDGITDVADHSFVNCKNLTDVYIPNSVQNIGNYAFDQCPQLNKVVCKATIPPIVGDDQDAQNGISLSAQIIPFLYVPYLSLDTYKSSVWSQYFNSILPVYTVTFKDKEGNVFDVQDVEYGSVVISPEAPDVFGYTFTGWDKDITNITEDLIVTAQYTRDAVDGLYYTYDCEYLTATLDHEGDGYAQIGKLNVPNTITYREKVFAVVAIGAHAFDGCDRLTDVVVPSNLEFIHEYAFNGCSDIENLILSAGIRSIADYAFNGCKRIEEITVYAERVPDLTETSFANVGNKKYIKVYVPENRVTNYKRDEYWSEFDINVKSAETTDEPVDDVIVDPDDNEVTLTWPTDNNADSYTIVITKNGEVICTLIFNANGQLIGIAFAPSRDGHSHAPAAKMANGGMQFTVTGLDIATRYNFTITTKDAMSNILAEYTGSFGTTGAAESIVQISNGQQATSKILRDGQILILRGDKTYTVTGQEVK